MATSKELLSKMEFIVPLKNIYRVIASCNYNVMNSYCPVLVKIKDPHVLAKNGGKPYLLQVWDREGQMLFERALA